MVYLICVSFRTLGAYDIELAEIKREGGGLSYGSPATAMTVRSVSSFFGYRSSWVKWINLMCILFVKFEGARTRSDFVGSEIYKNRRFFSGGHFDGVVESQSMGIKRESKRSASATSPCADLRAVYHNCFNRWYSEKFVKGQFDEEPCVSEWQKYRACLSVCLRALFDSFLLGFVNVV
ncbi:hypothetical protein SDJN02_17354, partial [Cucurbita argyrosperma subsp. argyrosperma]